MLNVPMPPGLSKKEQLELQKSESDRMFNFAEKWVMDYMCLITNTKINELFLTSKVELPQPVYTAPIKELDNARIEFSLDVVEHDYKLNIPPNLVDDLRINHVLGFIYHSIKEVFNAVVNNNIKPESAKLIYDSSFHLEINDDSLTFFPIYIYPQRRKELMLTQMKDEISKALSDKNIKQLEGKIVSDMASKCEQIDKLLGDISYDSNDAYSMEVRKNAEYQKNKRLGIKMNIVKLKPN
jgi:hypothetical protein